MAAAPVERRSAFGQTLRNLRAKRGLRQQDVADLCLDELTAQGVSRIECGDRYPNVRTLELIAGALDVRFEVTGDGTRLLRGRPRRAA